MPTDITINNITGASPFDVYICDNPITTCVYVATITSPSLPYVFQIPPVMDGQPSYNLKIVDDNNCVVIETLS